MSDKSQIQWTDATWNPVTGCTKVSPGCAHCYIERTPAFRVHGRKFVKGATDVIYHGGRLCQPLGWRRPRRVFVNSLSDLFHDSITDDQIKEVFTVMAIAHRHTFQILTKRPERMRALLSSWRADDMYDFWYAFDDRAREVQAWPLPNVWLGVSVENQHFADDRIPLLLQTPAAVRFISAEPLLGPVNIDRYLWDDREGASFGLDWVIVGGESGPGARPCVLAWLRSIVQQCKAAGVPCFVKQLGARPIVREGSAEARLRVAQRLGVDDCGGVHLHDHKGGDPAEWPEDLRVREFPAVPAAPEGEQ